MKLGWMGAKHRFLDSQDVELEPGCGTVVTCMVLALIGAGVAATCCFGVILTWWPSGG